MKIIVTGATGTAGRGIVKACLADERITKILILTRRNVGPEVEQNAKVEVILHDDFSTYPDELMSRLAGAEACLWAVGGRVDQFGNDKVLARKVGVEYTLAGATAIRDKLASQVPGGKPFRFVFCSGMLAEWDQDKSLFFLNDTRKIKGAVEKGLCELAKKQGDGDDGQDKGSFEVYVARPSYLVSPEEPVLKRWLSPVVAGISTVQLGKAMVRMAVDGHSEQIVSTYTLQKM